MKNLFETLNAINVNDKTEKNRALHICHGLGLDRVLQSMPRRII